MDAVISLLLLLLVVWLFADVLFLLLFRFVAFYVCMWVASQVQCRLAMMLLDMGFTERPFWAGLTSFTVVLGVCCFLLRCIAVRVRSREVGDAEAVSLDGFRIGLVCAICLAIFLVLASLTHGQLLTMSWIWLCVLAISISGLDVGAPSVMGRIANWFT